MSFVSLYYSILYLFSKHVFQILYDKFIRVALLHRRCFIIMALVVDFQLIKRYCVIDRYSIVLKYYLVALVLMVISRALISLKFNSIGIKKSTYAALYFFPILIILQAVFGGLLCKEHLLKIIFKTCSIVLQ